METPKVEEKDEDNEIFIEIHNYLKNGTNKKEENNNILIKYLKNKNIIKESDSLFSFINELLRQIKKGNNMIIPFIDPCYDLIEAYLNNNDCIGNEIFIQLIKNSFINRKNLIPIYAYFTELYSKADNITESDEKLNKLAKYINLWKLFYSYSEYKPSSDYSLSSFCFLGSGLELYGIDKLPDNISLHLNILFMKSNLLKLIDQNDYLISGETLSFKYSKLLGLKISELTSIDFKFVIKEHKILLSIIVNNSELLDKNEYGLPIFVFSDKVNILNNFYGQIKSIELVLFREYPNNIEDKIYSKIINPFPLKDNDGIIFSNEFEEKDIQNIDYDIYKSNKNGNEKKIEIKLKIKEKNLVKGNYINYNEEKFKIIDYFGGITQFLPFLKIINGIYKNVNIKKINNINKEDFLNNFVKDILLIIFNHINNSGKKKVDNFKNYWNFYFYLLNKIGPFKDKNLKIKIEDFSSYNVYDINNSKFFQIFLCFLSFINSNNKKEEEYKLKESFSKIFYNNRFPNNLIYIHKTNNQLYRHLMKELFIYNRLWSKQYLFFKNVYDCYKNNNNKEMKIRYKRINYYTCNFQQPLIYPILEMNNYYPTFNKFKLANLYKSSNGQNKEEILNYDFNLDDFEDNLITSLVFSYLDNNNIDKTIQCCLIKKMYHIKGEIGALQLSKKEFLIVFSSNNIENEEKCNKKNKYNNKEKNNHNSNLCYGSVFPCLKKDRKKFFVIPARKILFALCRIYYYRSTGFEIFTTDNKSYYFNFWEIFKINSNHRIVSIFEKNFLPIKEENGKFIGWYNPDYFDLLFPLFSEEIYKWNEKNYYYSNFDKLMLINLFSNRSLNDLNQYPVFPMLYYEIGLKRAMDQHIGFQDLTEESKSRMQLIKDSYYYENCYESETEDNNEKAYFNLYYSNITYTCNYLIRVFPYSFIAIEYQGDGFDDPNRLFYSINSTMHNTLNQRSDLRELIPEFFYFPQLFYNINELELKKLSNNKEIDNVNINKFDEKPKCKYIFLKNMRKYLEKDKDINLWIDLIFGINKDYYQNKEKYYNNNSYINFGNDPNILNDDIIMQSYDFGVLPYQILKAKFPKKNTISKNIENEIYIFNRRKFLEDHITCLIEDKESFICCGEKGINNQYLEIINEIKKENKYSIVNIFNNVVNKIKAQKNNHTLKYLFVGDVFGNLYVYLKEDEQSLNVPINNQIKEVNQEKDNINSKNKIFRQTSFESYIINQINNKYYKLIKTLNDHTNEIKYIDYNPRLNLVVDYALDGFLNLYTMPTLKLILSIQIKDFEINEPIQKVALFSNPLAMICCVSLKHIIVFDINGKLITKIENVEEKKICFCIDKNCGLFNDFISYWANNKENRIMLFEDIRI